MWSFYCRRLYGVLFLLSDLDVKTESYIYFMAPLRESLTLNVTVSI